MISLSRSTLAATVKQVPVLRRVLLQKSPSMALPKQSLRPLQGQRRSLAAVAISAVNRNDKFFINNTSPSGQSPDGKDPSQKEQLKKLNLGSMIDYLSEIIPEALNTTPDPARLNQNIRLRIAPSIHPNVPVITGQLKYITSLKATQLIFKSFILHSNTKLHILRVDVKYSDDDCHYGILKDSTKLVVHWKTCGDECGHLEGNSGALRAHQKEHDIKTHDFFHNLLSKYWVNSKAHNTDEYINERVLFGIFVFELNEMNDQILVHNVENLEVLDSKDFANDDVMGLCS